MYIYIYIYIYIVCLVSDLLNFPVPWETERIAEFSFARGNHYPGWHYGMSLVMQQMWLNIHRCINLIQPNHRVWSEAPRPIKYNSKYWFNNIPKLNWTTILILRIWVGRHKTNILIQLFAMVSGIIPSTLFLAAVLNFWKENHGVCETSRREKCHDLYVMFF